MSDRHNDHPDIDRRADKAAARQKRAVVAAERKKRIERIAFTVTEAAEAIGRDPATLFRWIKNGSLRASHVGGSTLVAKVELDRLLAEGAPLRGRPPRAPSGKFITKQSRDSAR